jgi:8-oxo-dGTP pyrophosphatase MutT (NUDIX family)
MNLIKKCISDIDKQSFAAAAAADAARAASAAAASASSAAATATENKTSVIKNNTSYINNNGYVSSYVSSYNSINNNSSTNNNSNSNNSSTNNNNNNNSNKSLYCHNCGKEGHHYLNCEKPVTSYGIILYYPYSDDVVLEQNHHLQNLIYGNLEHSAHFNGSKKLNYLLIMDRNTPDYAQIILGNYDLNDITYLRKLLGRLSDNEVSFLLKKSFKELFIRYWTFLNDKEVLKIHYKQYDKADYLFNKLREGFYVNGQFVNWKILLEESRPNWLDPDWGFPKGRRRRKKQQSGPLPPGLITDAESDLECALREFKEETGIDSDQYTILHDIEPIEEVVIGSNGLTYRHIYFLAEAKHYLPVFFNPFNSAQMSEISKIGWYTYDEAIKLIRPYHKNRLNILYRINRYLSSLQPYLK